MASHTYNSQFTTEFEFSQAKSATNPKNQSKMTVVYVHGLCSDPWGSKPEAIKQFCLAAGCDFFRFELAGHGSDKESFLQADFDIWSAQVLEVLDNLVAGPVIMMGSSLGGWLSIVAAEQRPQRGLGVITLAAACDLDVDLYKYALSDEQKAAVERGENINVGTPEFYYTFTARQITSYQNNAILGCRIGVSCPVHLLQGRQDTSFEWHKVFKIADCLDSEKVVVKLLKNSNHRLASESDLAEVHASLLDMLKTI